MTEWVGVRVAFLPRANPRRPARTRAAPRGVYVLRASPRHFALPWRGLSVPARTPAAPRREEFTCPAPSPRGPAQPRGEFSCPAPSLRGPAQREANRPAPSLRAPRHPRRGPPRFPQGKNHSRQKLLFPPENLVCASDCVVANRYMHGLRRRQGAEMNCGKQS
jgi:hypothetical protein